MRQAKKRGDAAQRATKAIEAGRVKTNTPAAFHDNPAFKVAGQEETLMDRLMHNLTYGAERFPAEIPSSPSPQAGTLS